MRTKRIGILLTVLISMVATKAFAYDIAVENEDGKTIYYNYINDGTELEVTYESDFTSSYSGDIIIPNEVTYMTETLKVTSIGRCAFNRCNGLLSVTIPNSVTNINEAAIQDCSSLVSVTIPNSVTSIENYNFYLCNSLTNITIPNSVISIGHLAFGGCSALTSITIPNSVKSIANSAFQDCSNLTSIVVERGNSVYDSRSNCNAIIMTTTNILVKGCNNSTIPNSVTSIGTGAFRGCSSLVSVNIPNSVISIGQLAFNGCSALTSITIPNSVVSIGQGAFSQCSSLTSITIPNSVTSIGHSAFGGCNSLTSITIPNSVTTIGGFAFDGCSALTSITFPNSVTSIGQYAFRDCIRLKSITIPNSVTTISGWAFVNCSELTSVVSLNENPSSIEDCSFSTNTFSNATLYVPQGAIDKYKATEGWKDFSHIEEINGNIMCATPTISYKNGKLSYNSETESAECHTTITDEDIKSFDGNEVNLSVSYNISVYATKDGYVDSYVATATLCWIEVYPQNEGIATDVNQIASVAVLIKANGGKLTIEGAGDNTTVTAYTLDGEQLGSAVSRNGVATINTNVSPGTVTIVKIGNKSVKVVMR